MFNEFCVTSIFTDLSQRKIVIETNFKVDKESVSYETVKLVNTENGLQQNYKLHIEDKNIVIILNEWPSFNTVYLLQVHSIKDVLKRTLNSSVSKEIVFVSDIKSKVQIVKPVHNEAFQLNPIEIEINAISEGEEGIQYRFEISPDMAFFDITKDTLTPNTKIKLDLDDGQYYVRARAERENEFGDWSSIVSFVVVTSVNCEHSPGESEFIDNMLISNEFFLDEETITSIIERTPNGTTDSEFYIVLNKDLDLSSLPRPFDVDPDFGQPHPEDSNAGLVLVDNIIIHRRDF